MVVCSRMCFKPNLSNSFNHTNDKHDNMLIVFFLTFHHFTFFLHFLSKFFFLETYQHLSQERFWIKCTQRKLYSTHDKGDKDSSKWQARCFFIVHILTSSRPSWYRPSINQLIPLCQDKKYIKKLQCVCRTYSVREGLKEEEKKLSTFLIKIVIF